MPFFIDNFSLTSLHISNMWGFYTFDFISVQHYTCRKRLNAKYLGAELGLCRNKMLLLPCCHFSFLSFYRCNEEQRMHLSPSHSFLLSLPLISRLSIPLPPYWSSNPIRLLRLRESHSEDMAAHLIWARIDRCMSCGGMQTVYVFRNWKCFLCMQLCTKK